MKYFQHYYCSPPPYIQKCISVHILKQNVPDNNEAHSSLQNCGLWTLLHDTLLVPEFGGGFLMFGEFVDPFLTVMWDVMTYPDDGDMRFL
jgi:hypothetical protein